MVSLNPAVFTRLLPLVLPWANSFASHPDWERWALLFRLRWEKGWSPASSTICSKGPLLDMLNRHILFSQTHTWLSEPWHHQYRQTINSLRDNWPRTCLIQYMRICLSRLPLNNFCTIIRSSLAYMTNFIWIVKNLYYSKSPKRHRHNVNVGNAFISFLPSLHYRHHIFYTIFKGYLGRTLSLSFN